MDLIKLINKKGCKTNIKGKDKVTIIKNLVKLSLDSPVMEGIEENIILNLLMDREKQGSTGIGEQIAIPHAGIPGLKEFVVCMATSKKGLDFNSIDKKKVRLFFLILGPEGKATKHLQILAAISRIISHLKVKNELLQAPTETALFESFIRHTHAIKAATGTKENLKLLTIILFDQTLIYSLLELFLQEGIDGCNITESSGMGEYISNVPLFAGFLGFMNEMTNKSKTIQAMIPESRVDEIIEGIENITGDLDTTQGAMLFITSVERWKGSMKMM